ncbi:MAG: diaminopimelate decarboxylase [Thermoproteota archaeon]|nr:MAG: diaminopimelate decarboxylase [Candidatus Korarchaeota archaeon]
MERQVKRENLWVNERGHLCIRGHDLVELAERFGTPLYVIDAQRIRENYRRFRDAFNSYPRVLIAYAYKANPNLAVCSILKEEGAGAEVVSGGELYIALKVGVNPEKIVFDGVSKGEDELKMAIEGEIGAINVESLEELRKIERIASKLGKKARIGVRLNPDVPVRTHPHDVTGAKYSKFGLDFESALKAYEMAMKMEHIEVKGIHIHIGSQITQVDSFRSAALRLFDLVSKLKEMGVMLEYLDFGGGLGITYGGRKDYLKEYARTLLELTRTKIGELDLGEPKLIFEPGRYIVADSSVLLTRVNYVKEIFGRKWVLVDAGMNDFMRPAMYGAAHQIVPVNKPEGEERYNVGGPICESSDVFGRDVRLPEMEAGDLLAIFDVGAYGICMSSQYNSRPRPAMILIDEAKVSVVRERETYEDLISKDRIPND